MNTETSINPLHEVTTTEINDILEQNRVVYWEFIPDKSSGLVLAWSTRRNSTLGNIVGKITNEQEVKSAVYGKLYDRKKKPAKIYFFDHRFPIGSWIRI